VAKAGFALSASVIGGSWVEAAAATPAAATNKAAQAASPVPVAAAMSTARERLLMDRGWRFALGNANDPDMDFGFGKLRDSSTFSKSGEAYGPVGIRDNAVYDDHTWETVDLPHDWAVGLPFVMQKELVWHGGKPIGRAFPETSVGWYRKTFDIPKEDLGKRISIEFDGIYRDAMIFINNHYLDTNFSGYAPPSFDITDFINYGASNVITVRADSSLTEGWFYEGAGIYRHVWLNKTAPIHVAQWGSVVRTEMSGESAIIQISTEVMNESDTAAVCKLYATVVDAAGKTVASVSASSAGQTIASFGSETIEMEARVPRPNLWSPDKPHIYKVITVIEAGGKVIDNIETAFGIRTIRFDIDKGFILNGKPLKIRGTCNHQDHAGVGSAIPDRLQYYRIELLKQMGSNAVRTSHNPPTPELLDACDRLGMLVMDETRQFSSSPEGMSELERMVKRDRNHPSIVIWSIANEERQQGTERGARIGTTMKRLIYKLDPTRPVTAAMSAGWGDGLSTIVDVQGFNYNEKKVDAYRAAHPKQPLIGSETASVTSTRGIYADNPVKGYVSSYTSNGWVQFYEERDWLAGGFAWTGFDYRGEPKPYHLPCVSSHFGLMDSCGFPKDNYFYYKTWWSPEPMLHVLPHWNWAGKEGEEIAVWCYCNQESVELFLNGKSLGSQPVVKFGRLVWKVKYAPGTLEARASSQGKVLLTAKRVTTGSPAKLALTPDRSIIQGDGEDMSILNVAVLDAQGNVVPTADSKITFEIRGPARFLGVGNGDPSCLEPDRPSTPTTAERSAFNGLCMALLQSQSASGDITVVVRAPGLAGVAATIKAAPSKGRMSIG
jgi:beta-galactosidase